ncbi:SDR family oxidoreductase [Hyphomonas sp. ND6WE1B]|uniref:SDR family oxidoreductase n=1 Tax=Hyphomonas sp. ND6WE1B TaxID=1848191 RepID=UPI000807631D|nr:SDR family oxidoreductase [Hyphomonas sp. ND6WE1B]
MKNLIVLGASGQIARHVIGMLSDETDVGMTLYLRNAGKLTDAPEGARIVEGDVLDAGRLDAAMKGQHLVYANLTGGNLDVQARAVIASMERVGVRRLIFVLSLGIYDEVPGKFGEWNNAIIGKDLVPFRKAGDAIEASGLDYTIIRPAWLTDHDEIDYETTGRNEPFKGTEVSRKSVAAFIASIIRNPDLSIGGNIGIDKPGTEGDKPEFMG